MQSKPTTLQYLTTKWQSATLSFARYYNHTITVAMSDLVLTIDSDGEAPPAFESSRKPAPGSNKAKGKKQQQAQKKREKVALEKGKKRAREEDGDEAEDGRMDAGFQFDAFGGGELGRTSSTSKKYSRTDAWVRANQGAGHI